MEQVVFATKGNLITAKNTLSLAKEGYDLLDKKRNILIRELMTLIDRAGDIQNQIGTTFGEAYSALQRANIDIGISRVQQVSNAVPKENSVTIKFRSVMGTTIPIALIDSRENTLPPFGTSGTSVSLDKAFNKFKKVKQLTVELATVENSAYSLAVNIKKTQKRANALKNIMIPKYEEMVSSIQNALEEKDREEYTRLKVIKKRK